MVNTFLSNLTGFNLKNSLWRLVYCAPSSNTVLQTDAGAEGDYLSGLMIVPDATSSPGSVILKNGSGAGVRVFTGGASSVGSQIPFPYDVNACSEGGPWRVITGSNVIVHASGQFS